jgi:very-short-patch-repair endonuclease/predicted transcriptional regulator of viral defense system
MRPKHRKRSGSEDESGVFRTSAGAVNRLARRQHGLVTRRQLLELGMESRAIGRRLESKRLIRVRRGVYRVGPIAQPWEPEVAAILAVGEGAVLSHDSAAFLYQLHPHPARPDLVHVTVTARQPGSKPDIQIHRATCLPPDEVTRRHRIPVTTPARTILDIAPDLDEAALEQVLAQAHRKLLATPQALHTLIARYPRRSGTPALRAALGAKPKLSRSKPERRLLEAFRRAGLPEPETNAPVAGFEVDFLWTEQALVVEVDGHPFHSARPDRRRDHERDARLTELGYAVLRLDADVSAERAVALVARATSPRPRP